MNPREREHCDKLRRSCDLATEHAADEFLGAIAGLRGSTSAEILEEMLMCFRDVDAGELQFELVDACESFPRQTYVEGLIKLAAKLSELSPTWFRLLFQSVLNSSEYVDCLVLRFPILPKSDREFIAKYVSELANENHQYAETADRLSTLV